jgi:hypothetical protein
LSAALDVPQAKLRKEFGTETALLETARKLLPDVVLAGLAEPLRTARTGRDAVHGMLEVAVSLRKGHRQLKDHTAAGPSLAMERNSDDQAIQHWGRSLEYQIHDRFARSVDEGELPEGANIRSLSALTLAVVNGLVFCVQEEVSA